MSEYTPTTDEVRAVWREWNGYGGLIDRTCPEPTTRAGMVAEFDAWLDRERAVARREGQAEAWADAIGEAYDCGWIHDYGRDEMIDRNPYRHEGDRHVDQ